MIEDASEGLLDSVIRERGDGAVAAASGKSSQVR
jgi:hypothetical protein